jgi:hypothetical protein
MQRSTSEYLIEIAECLAAFERSLPRQLDPVAMSSSKLPFKALGYRETLIWRITELGQAALENFKQKRFAAAILLTHAAVETAAALWFLHTKVVAVIKAESLGDIDDYLSRLALGSRSSEDSARAINVLKFVDHVNKKVAGFRKQYDELSGYSHPNYLGTACLYSETDFESHSVSFSANTPGSKPAETIGAMILSVSLTTFEQSYNAMADEMPAFVRLSERNLGI